MARYRLGAICQIISGSTPKTGVQEYWNGDKKWITPAELSESDYIIYDTERKLTEAGVKSAGLTPLPQGTVILSSRAPIGKVAIAGCEMYCNQGFKNFVCSDIINNKYLYWYLRSKTDFLNSLGRGATFKEISKSTVADIELDIPKLSEQSKRVAHLEKLQSIIASRRIQLAKLDELVKCRFVELFGDPVTNSGNWETRTIEQICENLDYKRKPISSEKRVSGIYPYYGASGIVDYVESYIFDEPLLLISEDGANLLARSTPIAFSVDGKIWVNNHAHVLKFHDIASQKYVEALFSMIDISHLITGSAQPKLNQEKLNSFSIPWPPIHLQVQYNHELYRIDKLRFIAGRKKSFEHFMNK